MEAETPLRACAAASDVVVGGSDQQVLVLVRVRRPGPGGRPEVRLPKGHMEAGGERSTAALREVREESGLSNRVITLLLDGRPLRQGHDPPELQYERLWVPQAEARHS